MHSLILRDAHLVPVGSATPTEPVDVLVEDGRVVEVGPTLHRPEGVEEVRADGRWLIPGLWDQHVHLAQWTLTSGRLDLAGARSPEDALHEVRVRVEASKNRLMMVRPCSTNLVLSARRFCSTKASDRSSRMVISSGDRPSIPSRWRCGK